MFNNGIGQLHATDLIFRTIKSGYQNAFSSLIEEASINPPSYLLGWNAASSIPALVKIADGPLETIQPKHPALVITPTGGTRNYPMASYSFDISYTYACPKMLGDIDVCLVSCELAQEAVFKILKDSALLAGYGWSLSSWSLSELREASLPTPLFSRTLSLTITLQIEEDY